MIIRVQIMDASNNSPLPGASVTLVDKNGNYLGQGAAASDDGKVYLDSLKLEEPNVYVLLSNVSYQSAIVEPAVINKSGYTKINLIPDSEVLDPVIVTPGKEGVDWWLWLLFGAGLGLLAITSAGKKKKRYGRTASR